MTLSARTRTIVSWLLLALAVALLRYRIALTSDSLFYESLATDLMRDGGLWRDWKFSAAPGFVIDMAAYMLAFPLLPDAVARMHAVSILQAAALAWVSCFAARTIAPTLRASALALIVLLTAFATLVSAKSGMWLYFHTTNNHVSMTLAALLLVALLIRFLQRPSFARALGAAAIAAMATASTRLFVLGFTAPVLLLAAAIFVALAWRAPAQARAWRGRLGAVAGIMLAGQLLGMLAEHLLVHHAVVEARPPISADSIASSAAWLLKGGVGAFTPDNLSTFVFSLSVALSLAYLLFCLFQFVSRMGGSRRLPAADAGATPATPPATPAWRLPAAGALLLVCIPVTIGGLVLSAAAVDAAACRYLMFPIALAAILALVCLDRSHAPGWRGFERAWLALAVVLAVAGFQHAKKARRPVDEAALVAQCLAGLERAGWQLDAGIADYWNARAVSYYLPRRQSVLATLNSVWPLFWVSSAGPLLHPERYQPRRYNFVLLRDPAQPGQFFYTEAALAPHLPAPSSKHACAGTGTRVWYYSGTQLDTVVDARIARFVQSGLTLLPP